MNIVAQVILPLALASIMFAMGLGLVPADFARVVKQPRAFTLGALMQVIALPLVGLAFAAFWTDVPYLAVGIMLLAACPGGMTSNLLTHIGRGDVALSITLTAVISLLGMLTVPLILEFALHHYMGADAPPLPLAKSIIGVFVLTTVPVALGMFIKAKAPRFAETVEKQSRTMAGAIFVLVMIGAVISERERLLAHLDGLLVTMIVFNILMMVLAALVARLGRVTRPQRIAITLECGLQNGTLAVVVAGTMLGRIEFAIPAALYSIWMFVSAAVYIMIVNKTRPRSLAESPAESPAE